MPTPTIAGQFRRVHYTDDGCNLYQCLWCMNSIEIRDDPQYGWNFCPKCGKSWFKQLHCRAHTLPRWVWDRWGDEYPHDLPIYAWKRPVWKWIIEERTKWHENDWGEWHYETYCNIDFGELGAWRQAQQRLNYCRARVAPEPGIPGMGVEYEYRAKLEKI